LVGLPAGSQKSPAADLLGCGINAFARAKLIEFVFEAAELLHAVSGPGIVLLLLFMVAVQLLEFFLHLNLLLKG
jgi:hypothetical protein